MRRMKLFSCPGVLLLLFAACTGLHAATSVGDLRCEHLDNPLGIDVTEPRLSWMLESNKRDVNQSAYQILVASSGKKLAQDNGDLWDSGKVTSDQSILVPYAGQPLVSREACFWKVRVWNAAGQESAWSKPARWSMGILSADDWHARWIGLDGEDEVDSLSGTSWIWSDDANSPTNYFRRVVTIPPGSTIKRAVFEYTGDSECRGWIGQFDLGARNNFKTVKWNDITTRLEPGKTYVFGLTGSHNGKDRNPAGVIGKLTIEFAEGEPMGHSHG